VEFARAIAWKKLMKDVKKVLQHEGVAIIHNQKDADYLIQSCKFPIDRIIVAAPSNITNEMRAKKLEIVGNHSSLLQTSRVQDVFNTNFNDFWIVYVGFLNDYKGLDYAIQSLKLLPNNFRLLVIGSVHERSADQFVDAHPLTRKLLSFFPEVDTRINMDRQPVSDGQKVDAELLSSEMNRVHFIASPSDAEITEAIMGSNAVSLLYRNVEQSASGPLVEALELGATCVTSNNRLFRSFRFAAGKSLRLVDVGNLLQIRDTYLQLETQSRVVSKNGLRYTSYPWSNSIDFRKDFGLGYAKALRILGFAKEAAELETSLS
jgi:glycosyltransferase involved in cell wall biosynthesis